MAQSRPRQVTKIYNYYHHYYYYRTLVIYVFHIKRVYTRSVITILRINYKCVGAVPLTCIIITDYIVCIAFDIPV